MIRYFFNTVQGRVIGIMLLFMIVTFGVSYYTIRNVSQSLLNEEKGDKLIGVAEFLDKMLGDTTYNEILIENDALDLSRDEKIEILNNELHERTDYLASIYQGLGIGYYSLELDACLTYGPSAEFASSVGTSIDDNHPGRTVMAEGIPATKMGTMVRGNIMNAMYPIIRNGEVIGYTWANELTTDIEAAYESSTQTMFTFFVIVFMVSIVITVLLSRRMIRDLNRIVAGVRKIRYDLTVRITGISGEFVEIADSINNMASHIERTSKEHEALILANAANKAQKDFLARMSHEIRTPMNGVLGMANLAMQAESQEKSVEYLKKIQSSAALLLGIINDILDFSKIEANKIDLEIRPFKIKEAIYSVSELIMPKVDEKNLHMDIVIDESVPDTAVGDGLKLMQITLNLLGNAVKFTLQGNIELRVAAEHTEEGKIKLNVSIKDTGIGMTEEQMSLLFRPFSQADSSTVRKFGGTGLGLSISKALVEIMGGAISVESVISVGSTFLFYVMLDVADENAIIGNASNEAALNQRYDGYKALLAEDIEINQEIAIAILSDFGMEITVADNGQIAVDMYANNEYDVIFMDIRMPIMDGLEATEKIREIESERGITKRIPIIAMTANAMQDDRIASKKAGMNGHVSKPIDIEEIQNVLYELLITNKER